jgi:hypothetical protein
VTSAENVTIRQPERPDVTVSVVSGRTRGFWLNGTFDVEVLYSVAVVLHEPVRVSAKAALPTVKATPTRAIAKPVNLSILVSG